MSRPTTVYQPPELGTIHPFSALTRLCEFGDLFVTLSIHRVKIRYKQSRLGILWAILQPLAMMLVFTLMFTVLRTAPSADVPFPLFAYSALVPWTAFASGLSNATTALTSHAALLTKVSFPREILPLTYIVAALVDLTFSAVILVPLMLWFHVAPTMTALWCLPAIVVLIAFLLGAGLLLSAVQVRYRDVGLAMPVLIQIWLFATPVLYPLDAVRHALPASLYALYTLNPMAAVVETFRRALVLHQPPDLAVLATSIVVVALIAPCAYLYFKYIELTMADVV